MRTADVAKVSVAGSDFALRRSGDRIEALRISPEAVPDKRDTLVKALAAIQVTTGCNVRAGSLTGDQAVVRAELDCDGDKPPLTIRQVTVALDCEAAENWRIDGLNQDYSEVDCTLLPLPR
jgi:hypothetical protein